MWMKDLLILVNSQRAREVDLMLGNVGPASKTVGEH